MGLQKCEFIWPGGLAARDYYYETKPTSALFSADGIEGCQELGSSQLCETGRDATRISANTTQQATPLSTSLENCG